MATFVFPDLDLNDTWRANYAKWRELKDSALMLEQIKPYVDAEFSAELEEELIEMRLEMAELSPPERFLWLEGRPILDRWMVAGELEQSSSTEPGGQQA